MSAVALDDTTHSDGGRTFEESSSNDGISPRDGITATSDGENSIMDTLNDLADAGFHTGLVTKVSNVLAALSNNDTRFLGGNNGTQGHLSLSIFLVRLRGELPVGAESFVHFQLIQRVHDIAASGRKQILRRHDCLLGGRVRGEGSEEQCVER